MRDPMTQKAHTDPARADISRQPDPDPLAPTWIERALTVPTLAVLGYVGLITLYLALFP
jgi:hypothetical protein